MLDLKYSFQIYIYTENKFKDTPVLLICHKFAQNLLSKEIFQNKFKINFQEKCDFARIYLNFRVRMKVQIKSTGKGKCLLVAVPSRNHTFHKCML